MTSWMRMRVDGGWRKEVGVVRCGRELGVGSIMGFGPSMGGMLVFTEGVVLEPVEGLVDISWHGNVNGFVVIIPVAFHGDVQGASPVCGDDI
jgi:hypothetical protein